MSLKFSFSVLWLLIFAAVCAGTDFYVWRRGWDDAESGILPPLSGDGLTILAAELEKDGRVTVVNVPPTLWQSPRRTAAIRVHVGWLGRKKLENTLAVIIERLPRELPVQLDIDVPESRLAEYAPLLKRLRRRFPARGFSITALPCHLRHREFLAAAEQVDYYVLQLHGVEAPKQLGKEVALMERRTALAAVAAAKKLKLPFRIALPSYAYQFNYRSSDRVFPYTYGAFL